MQKKCSMQSITGVRQTDLDLDTGIPTVDGDTFIIRKTTSDGSFNRHCKL